MIITGDDMEAIVRKQLRSSSDVYLRWGKRSTFRALIRGCLFAAWFSSLTSVVCYTTDLVARARLSEAKPVDTLLELNVKLRPTDGEPVSDPTLYRQLVGSLL